MTSRISGIGRTKLLLFAGLGVAIIAIAGLSIVILGRDDDRGGGIKAADVCRNMSDRQGVARDLGQLLPDSDEYRFKVGSEVKEPGTEYRTACFVYGESGTLFSVRADMTGRIPVNEWVAGEVQREPSLKGSAANFNAGERAVASSQAAAMYVPCYKQVSGMEKGADPRYDITLTARLAKASDVEQSKARKLLANVATSFARQVHKDAKCDLPSKLPN